MKKKGILLFIEDVYVNFLIRDIYEIYENLIVMNFDDYIVIVCFFLFFKVCNLYVYVCVYIFIFLLNKSIVRYCFFLGVCFGLIGIVVS